MAGSKIIPMADGFACRIMSHAVDWRGHRPLALLRDLLARTDSPRFFERRMRFGS